jgi:hypothetical protein
MGGSHFWSIQLNVTFDTKGLFIVIIIILYSFLMFVTISLDRPRVFVAILVVLMKNQTTNYRVLCLGRTIQTKGLCTCGNT